jgi:hypothetical protein
MTAVLLKSLCVWTRLDDGISIQGEKECRFILILVITYETYESEKHKKKCLTRSIATEGMLKTLAVFKYSICDEKNKLYGVDRYKGDINRKWKKPIIKLCYDAWKRHFEGKGIHKKKLTKLAKLESLS